MSLVTIAIIVVTCAVSFTCFNNQAMLMDLLFYPPQIRKGQYYRFITYGFVHADGTHLLFNMITLFFFGRAVEPFFAHYIGLIGFAGFYLLGLVVSIVPSYVKHARDANYRSLGASGAVSAVLFVYILLAPWSTIYVFIIPVPAILFAVAYVGYSIYAEHRATGNVNHGAHLWGAAYGVVFVLLMEPAVGPHFLNLLGHPMA